MSEYDEYYINTIKEYTNGGKNGEPGGWAGLYYGIFSYIIRENNFKKCVEVGIGYGLHAKEILDNTAVEQLYLVDPMCYYENDSFADTIMQYGGFEKHIKNVLTHLRPYENRYTWFRCPSLDITNEQIPDNSIDAIFIDGDHSYDAVSKDLPFWWNKLKIGGWLLGDDYASSHIGTTKAIDEFAQKNNLELEFLTKSNSSIRGYPIYKFIKQ
jgi:hypothetical protein